MVPGPDDDRRRSSSAEEVAWPAVDAYAPGGMLRQRRQRGAVAVPLASPERMIGARAEHTPLIDEAAVAVPVENHRDIVERNDLLAERGDGPLVEILVLPRGVPLVVDEHVASGGGGFR